MTGISGSNFIFSPLSIAYIMSMLHAGAYGNTEAQLTKVLGRKSTMQDLSTAYTLFNGPGIKMANAVLIKAGVSIDPEYLQMAQRLALVSNEDFNNRAAIAYKVNSFVEKNTNGLIKNIFNENIINYRTFMILINTLYFKMKWRHPFEKYSTRLENFNGRSQVNMMRQTEYFPYYEDSFVQVVELPYTGEYCMGIILPWDKGSTANYAYPLTNTKTYQNAYVDLRIPKFTHRRNIDLIPMLQKLGVTDLFDSQHCRLDRMSYEPAYVSNMVHEAVVIVDEVGTEAAAATICMSDNCLSSEPQPIVFNANHSFIYYIKHSRTNTLLFVGEYAGN